MHGFLWRDGTMIDLGDATEADTQALDINDRGTVAGITTRSGTQQAALWRAGAWTILPTPTAGDQGAALAVNDRGQAVGSDDVLRAPMLWTATSFTDLSATGRCPVLPLYDINDAGWILGAGPDPAHATPFGGVWHGPAVCARGAVIRLPALSPDTADNWPVRMTSAEATAAD